MRADNRPTRKPTKLKQRFFHAGGNATWKADSFRGLLLAVALGFRWIDTNHQVTKDGVSVCIHWGRPLMHGWRDPLGKIKRTARVRDLTWEEISRLRLRNGTGYRIRTTEQIIRHAGAAGIGVEVELKNAHWTEAQAAHLLSVAHAAGVPVIAKTLSTLGGKAAARKRLTTFHRAGWTTVVLPRGARRIPRVWWPVVDHVRGRVIWTGPTAAHAA